MTHRDPDFTDFRRYDYDAETKGQRNRRYIAIAALLTVITCFVWWLIATA